MTVDIDPYAFIEDSEPRTRYPETADNLQNDDTQPPVDTIYANSAVNDDVTEPETVPVSEFEHEPGKFFTQHVPRRAEITDAVMFSIYVPGDGVPRLFIARNPARARLRWFTDTANGSDITIRAKYGDGGIPFSAGCMPFAVKSTNEFYCSATVAGTLYVVEETYANGPK